MLGSASRPGRGARPVVGTRGLIVNADDFGISAGVNRGIVEGHEHGIVTSASLMVRKPAAAEAATFARARPSLGVGLHVDLGEWEYRDGTWVTLYEVAPSEVEKEVRLQVEAFRDLVGADPTHLDSHQHVHRDGPARAAMVDIARELDVPLRFFAPEVRHAGGFYGQGGHGEPYPAGIEVDALLRILEELPPGLTELSCHPGYAGDLESGYAGEREQELRALTDRRVLEAVALGGISLRSFAGCSSTGSPRT